MGKTHVYTLLVMAALAGLGAGCIEPEENEADDIAMLEAMEREIDALIGDAACTGGADCRAVAFGAKPCGGPWTYKVFSAAEVDTTELWRRIAAYNNYNARLNETWNWASDCAFVTEPAVGCVEGSCQVVIP